LAISALLLIGVAWAATSVSGRRATGLTDRHSHAQQQELNEILSKAAERGESRPSRQ